MKNFEKQFGPRPFLETATQSDITTMTHDDFYNHMKQSWRKAYESIRNEILNKSRRASHASILGFIDEELAEELDE